MSYTPTVWKAGDTVTSTKLNKLEQGIANNILIINATGNEVDGFTLDKTWQEIHDANFCIIKTIKESEIQYSIVNLISPPMYQDDSYTIRDSNGVAYLAETADSYPNGSSIK